MTIYECFVICFETLNGPLSRLTTQYIFANMRPGGYYNAKVIIVLYCKYLKAGVCGCQVSSIYMTASYEELVKSKKK